MQSKKEKKLNKESKKKNGHRKEGRRKGKETRFRMQQRPRVYSAMGRVTGVDANAFVSVNLSPPRASA